MSTVRLDVFEDFTCPACKQLSTIFLPQLSAAYGNKIDIHKHYLTGFKSPTSAEILYLVALKHGRGDEISSALFSAQLDHHDANKTDPIVNRIAISSGLVEDYQKAIRDPKISAEVKHQWDVEGSFITFLPSVVISNRVLTDGNPENLNVIINSLLKNPGAVVVMEPKIKEP